MKRFWWVWFFMLTASVASADTLAERLIARYERVETITCDVRRDVSNEDGRLRWLSRVYYQQPDRLHVENHAPLPRRIIADGETMYQHSDGEPRGFRRAIAELDDRMLHGLRKVPGTAMDHLYRLQGTPEQVLDGDSDYPPVDGDSDDGDRDSDYPLQRGYDAENVYVVLHADEAYRLGRLEFYTDSERTEMTGEIDFSAFEEVLEDVWIPLLHQGRFQVGGLENRETTRISNVTVNEPIPEHLFNAAAFFDNVDWVDRFEDL